jgi:DNA-binding LacI/PurR family transcriptional regulator
MPNQRDVARAAGVSSASVSRYLTNPQSVSPMAAEAIRRAIDALGYRLDPSAQALRTGKSRHVGVLSPGGGPFHWAAYSTAQAILHEAGYYSTLYLTWGPSGPDDPLAPVQQGRPLDGVLFFPTLHPTDGEALDWLVSWGRPVVILDRPLPHSRVPQVYFDNYAAGARAARELLDRGHREFLFLWGRQEFASAQNRFQGFRDELRKAGIALPLDRQIEGEFFSLTAYEETKRRWDRLPPFTAVFASNDSSALGFLKAARERGLVSPADFSLVGYDDNFEFTLLYDPPLATFSQPAEELGGVAARMLLDLLEGRPLVTTEVALEARFVPRASLAAVPAAVDPQNC